MKGDKEGETYGDVDGQERDQNIDSQVRYHPRTYPSGCLDGSRSHPTSGRDPEGKEEGNFTQEEFYSGQKCLSGETKNTFYLT